MFRVTAPLLSRQWTPKQIRHFKKQAARSLHATRVRKSLLPKYMPSWTRHDIWTEDSYPRNNKKTAQSTTQEVQQKVVEQKQQKQQQQQQQQQPQQQQAKQEPEMKEEKKSKFKFW